MTPLALLAAAAATSLLPVSVVMRAPASSQTALSVFRESAPDRCTWLRVDPVQGRRERISEFPLACEGLSASWNPDATRAEWVLWLGAVYEYAREFFWFSISNATSRRPFRHRYRHAWYAVLLLKPN